MLKKFFVVVFVLSIFFSVPAAFCQERQLTPEQVKEVAVKAVKEQGIELNEVDIIYDDGNKLWAEKLGALSFADPSPNYGILKQGFLKNYLTVYFDYKAPIKDVWVFVDKDTGEVLTVYREE